MKEDGTYLTGQMRHNLKLAPGVEPPDPNRPVSRGGHHLNWRNADEAFARGTTRGGSEVKPDIDYHGESVLIKPDDPVYPRKRAKIVRVDTREGSAYLGLEVEQHGVDHLVWRYVNQVEFMEER